MKYTRQDYLEGQCDFDQYYGQFITKSVELRVSLNIGITRIVRSTDRSFNDIPLKLWDDLGFDRWTSIAEQLKSVGDVPSLSLNACLGKAMAKQIRDRYPKPECCAVPECEAKVSTFGRWSINNVPGLYWVCPAHAEAMKEDTNN